MTSAADRIRARLCSEGAQENARPPHAEGITGSHIAHTLLSRRGCDQDWAGVRFLRLRMKYVGSHEIPSDGANRVRFPLVGPRNGWDASILLTRCSHNLEIHLRTGPLYRREVPDHRHCISRTCRVKRTAPLDSPSLGALSLVQWDSQRHGLRRHAKSVRHDQKFETRRRYRSSQCRRVHKTASIILR